MVYSDRFGVCSEVTALVHFITSSRLHPQREARLAGLVSLDNP